MDNFQKNKKAATKEQEEQIANNTHSNTSSKNPK